MEANQYRTPWNPQWVPPPAASAGPIVNCFKAPNYTSGEAYVYEDRSSRRFIIILFILIILIAIAVSIMAWDLYRDGGTVYLQRSFANAQRRNIQLA